MLCPEKKTLVTFFTGFTRRNCLYIFRNVRRTLGITIKFTPLKRPPHRGGEIILCVMKLHLQGAISKDAFPPDVLEAYKYTFSKPGALTAPINYYRCMMNSRSKAAGKTSGAVSNGVLSKISIPTLLIWVSV